MRTFSVRLDEDLYQKLEQARGNTNKADYIREVLDKHLNAPLENLKEPLENTGEPYENHQEPDENIREPDENIREPDENLISEYKDQIEYLRSKLDEALKLVHQSQVLQLQQQRLLPDPNTQKKSWNWMFWKR